MFVIYVLCVQFVVFCSFLLFFFFKQKTAYEMRISDWSSDVCSSDLRPRFTAPRAGVARLGADPARSARHHRAADLQQLADACAHWPAIVLAGDRKSVV